MADINRFYFPSSLENTSVTVAIQLFSVSNRKGYSNLFIDHFEVKLVLFLFEDIELNLHF